MIEPFRSLPEAQRRTIQYGASVAAVILLAGITVLGLPLRTGAAPLGIVSLQLAAAPDVAGRMLDSWTAVPRARVLWAHGLDLLLPVAYALAIGTAATRTAARSARALPAAQLAAGAAITAAIADQVENVAMAATLLAGPGWPGVLVTLAAATVKYMTLVLAAGALAVSFRNAGDRARDAAAQRTTREDVAA